MKLTPVGTVSMCFLLPNSLREGARLPQADGVLRDSITWNDMREKGRYSGVLLPNMTLALKKTPRRATGQ